MSCPGLHCPGCSGGQSLAILGGTVALFVFAAETVAWVAERIFWIGGTLALCFVLAVAASMWLERWSATRAARWGAARGILSRADVILPEPRAATLTATVIPQAAAGARPAIEHHHHGPVFNFYGPDAEAQAARVIRALPGDTGQILTEGESS
jgi:hypothetical protein